MLAGEYRSDFKNLKNPKKRTTKFRNAILKIDKNLKWYYNPFATENSSKITTNIFGGEIMKRDEKNQTKKIIVRVHIGGKKKPVTKEAIVCSKSGKIMKFL